MDNINNSSNINNKPKVNVPKNLPKQLPPELLKAQMSGTQGAPKNLPKKLPQNLQQQRSAINKQDNAIKPQPKQKNLDDLLNKDYSQPQQQEKPVDNVVHQTDKQFLHQYNKACAYYRKTVKNYRKNVLKSTAKLKLVKNVFFGNIPDMLWFFNRRKVRNIFNKLDMVINRSVTNHRGVLMAIVIVVLISAIIGTGVYLAFIITKNISQADSETVGEISLNFEDVSEAKGGKTRLNINGARLNQNLEAHPTVFNNTNIYLYLRFYIQLDYVRGKDYMGVNIKDLSVKANLDDEHWWYDDADGMAYYLFTLAPDDKMTLFNSFQINGKPSLETAWQGKSLTATINVEVCQVLGEGQEFPPSWATYWTGLITATE